MSSEYVQRVAVGIITLKIFDLLETTGPLLMEALIIKRQVKLRTERIDKSSVKCDKIVVW